MNIEISEYFHRDINNPAEKFANKITFRKTAQYFHCVDFLKLFNKGSAQTKTLTETLKKNAHYTSIFISYLTEKTCFLYKDHSKNF
jgi:hypothetical protein